MRNFDLAFVDVETTGLGFDSEIIEIAVITVSHESLEVLEEWSVKIKPKYLDRADPESLVINGYNDGEWADALEIKPALQIFLEKTSGKVLAGHNLCVDWLWLHRSLFENGMLSSMKFESGKFYYQGFDTISLAYSKLRNVLGIEKFSLEELTKYFGISRLRAHRALDDARVTYELFVKLVNY